MYAYPLPYFIQFVLSKAFFRYAHTNSPIESFNNYLKLNFTCRLKHNLIPAIKILEVLISYESNKMIKFKTFGTVNKSMMNRAYRLINRKSIIRLTDSFKYTRNDNSFETIITRPLDDKLMSCTCSFYLDKAVCHHLLAATVIDNVSFPGVKKKVKKYMKAVDSLLIPSV